MPRPRRFFEWVAPSLSRRSLSFMVVLLRSGLRLVHYADEMLHRSDHAAYRRAVLKGAAAVPLVQTEPDQRCTLLFRPADRAADLLHGNRLRCFLGHDGNPWS